MHHSTTHATQVAPIDKRSPAPTEAKVGVTPECTQIRGRGAGAAPRRPRARPDITANSWRTRVCSQPGTHPTAAEAVGQPPGARQHTQTPQRRRAGTYGGLKCSGGRFGCNIRTANQAVPCVRHRVRSFGLIPFQKYIGDTCPRAELPKSLCLCCRQMKRFTINSMSMKRVTRSREVMGIHSVSDPCRLIDYSSLQSYLSTLTFLFGSKYLLTSEYELQAEHVWIHSPSTTHSVHGTPSIQRAMHRFRHTALVYTVCTHSNALYCLTPCPFMRSVYRLHKLAHLLAGQKPLQAVMPRWVLQDQACIQQKRTDTLNVYGHLVVSIRDANLQQKLLRQKQWRDVALENENKMTTALTQPDEFFKCAKEQSHYRSQASRCLRVARHGGSEKCRCGHCPLRIADKEESNLWASRPQRI